MVGLVVSFVVGVVLLLVLWPDTPWGTLLVYGFVFAFVYAFFAGAFAFGGRRRR